MGAVPSTGVWTPDHDCGKSVGQLLPGRCDISPVPSKHERRQGDAEDRIRNVEPAEDEPEDARQTQHDGTEDGSQSHLPPDQQTDPEPDEDRDGEEGKGPEDGTQGGGNTLAAPSSQIGGRDMPENSGDPGHLAGSLADHQREGESGNEALQDVEEPDERTPSRAHGPADIRGPWIAGTDRAEIDVPGPADERSRVDSTDRVADHRRQENGENRGDVHGVSHSPTSGARDGSERGEMTTATMPGPTCAPTTPPTEHSTTFACG